MAASCPDPHRGSYHQHRVCRICGLRIPRLIGPAPRRDAAPLTEAEALLRAWRERRERRQERLRQAQEASRARKNEREFERASRVLEAKYQTEASRREAEERRRQQREARLAARQIERAAAARAQKTPEKTPRRTVNTAHVFPRPVVGAPPEPVRAPRVLPELRRSDCSRQESCLDQAVRAGWPGFSCTKCSGYVRLVFDLPERRGSAEVNAYPLDSTLLASTDESNAPE